MRRRQFVEIEDLAWCRRAVRDGGTDWLGFMANATGMFNAVAPHIRRAMDMTGTNTVLDLCSGGGGPWLTLQRELAKSGPIDVILSDLYPNICGSEWGQVLNSHFFHALAPHAKLQRQWGHRLDPRFRRVDPPDRIDLRRR